MQPIKNDLIPDAEAKKREEEQLERSIYYHIGAKI